MTVAKVTEISCSSSESFEDAIRQGIARAGATLHNMQSAWVKEQNVVISGSDVVEWRVNLKITFVLDE
jgi:flavin-binding protein dodecin